MSKYDLVDPALELSDPNPDIHLLFIDFNDRFFDGMLAGCEVKWSPRMFSCDGPCRDRRPFFGYVKRSSNRAPGPNDLWWKAHKASCNGTFQKISEPEGYGQKKRKAASNENAILEKKASRKNSLDRYFTGKGQTLGSGNISFTSPGHSKLLDLFSSNAGVLPAAGLPKPLPATPTRPVQSPTSSRSSDNDKKQSPRKESASPTKIISPNNTLDRYFTGSTFGGTQSTTAARQRSGIPNDSRFYKSSISGGCSSKEEARRTNQPASSNTTSVNATAEIISVESSPGPSRMHSGALSSSGGTGSANQPIELVDDDIPLELLQAEEDQVNLNKCVYCPSCGDRIIEFYINEHLDICIAAQ